jgi:hypothetical protein
LSAGWIGVDLDGTLAHYDGWQGCDHIGAPIAAMVERVKDWLSRGQDVRIFTARVSGNEDEAADAKICIEKWCEEHLGEVLPVTCSKDYSMIELWDDRCVQLVPNTGRTVREDALREDGEY